jgi:ankyrin repeat protein
MTALHITANSGYSYLTKVLLQKFRANPVAKDAEGRTPLHLAVAKRHISCMVRIFIEGGELKCLDNQKRDVFSVTPDANTKHLLEKLEEVKFIIRSKGIRDIRQYRI